MGNDVLKQYRSVSVLHIVQNHLPVRKLVFNLLLFLVPDGVSFYFILLISSLQPNCSVQNPQIPPQEHAKKSPQLFKIFILIRFIIAGLI